MSNPRPSKWPVESYAGTKISRERRVLRWVGTGLDDVEIGRRFGLGERWVAQVRFLAAVPRTGRAAADSGGLRPIERHVLRWREQGSDYADLSGRFRRSPGFLARVEVYARYQLVR
jgi:hypothetical protein